MKIEIKAPELSESIATGTLLTWHKQPGEKVLRDETLIDLETDKVILEVPAPADGMLVSIAQPEGAVVKAGDVLAVMESNDAGIEAISRAATAEQPTTPPVVSPPAKPVSTQLVDPPRSAPKSEALPTKRIPDDGPHRQRQGVTQQAGRETRTPMSRLRQRVAERLVAAQQTAAILTTFNEVNMQPVNELRQRFKAEFETRHGIKLGYMSFFVRAVCDALRQFPIVNASIAGR